MIDLIKQSEEVYLTGTSITYLGGDEVMFLKSAALQSKKKRARICAHLTNEDTLHEMLIAISSKSYIQPHKHEQKSESFHIIEGIVDVVIFNDDGGIYKIIELGDGKSGRSFYYRMSESRFHTLYLQSDLLIMHEVTNGPFQKGSSIPAPFAPTDTDVIGVTQYSEKLSHQIFEFKLSKSNV
jgi:cupin fold WbuC family metalloprotein